MFRVLILSCCAAFATLTATAQTAPATNTGTTITVTLDNVRNRDGRILAELRTEQAWSRGKRFMGTELDVPKSGPVVLRFTDVPPGRYAVRLFQDRNRDNELQTNFVGLPAEPWGMSNNPSLLRGAPKFADAAFDVGPDGATQTIKMR
jgi:uncharacterized protein (DUF2141 family)